MQQNTNGGNVIGNILFGLAVITLISLISVGLVNLQNLDNVKQNKRVNWDAACKKAGGVPFTNGYSYKVCFSKSITIEIPE